MTPNRIYLSPPHMSGREQIYFQDAFDSNWIAPLGPHVDAFEAAICDLTGAKHALALASGTAAIHLSLIHLGIQPGDEVFVSTLTFSASVNPILYCGATPVFIDSEHTSWNMDPDLLAEALADRARQGKLPKAVIIVHLYGQTADMARLEAICAEYDVPIIEDAAEALGASHGEKQAGTFGRAGIFSFNGNKIITTSGGGMLVSDDADLIAHARKLSQQAREPAPHYQHTEIGYNYRLSNLLAAVGRAQLEVLPQRVQQKRAVFDYYRESLHDLPGLTFMPEAEWGMSNRWLTVVQIDPQQAGLGREQVRLALEKENIESRPVWKPMHCQPVFSPYPSYGGATSEQLFADGLCLPSGTAMTTAEMEYVVSRIKQTFSESRP